MVLSTLASLCRHHRRLSPKRFSSSHTEPPWPWNPDPVCPLPSLWTAPCYLLLLQVCPLQEFQINGITLDSTVLLWLASFTNKMCRVHPCSGRDQTLLPLQVWVGCLCTERPRFVYPSVGGPLGCSHLWLRWLTQLCKRRCDGLFQLPRHIFWMSVPKWSCWIGGDSKPHV